MSTEALRACAVSELAPRFRGVTKSGRPRRATAVIHRRQLTGSLIAAPILTMATSKCHHLRHAIEPRCSGTAPEKCRRPGRWQRLRLGHETLCRP
jgi:hypothetical protein